MYLAGDQQVAGAVGEQTRHRYARYSTADIEDVEVWRARSEEDWQNVATLRRRGFDRVGNKNIEWVDESERSAGSVTLLATKDSSGPIATLRIQDEKHSALELTKFVNVDALVSDDDRPLVQFSRLSVEKHPCAISVMFGLFKSAWLWSFNNALQSIVISTPPWAKAIYEFMAFRDYGDAGAFTHPLLPQIVHSTMLLPVQNAEKVWRAAGQPLCRQLFEERHPRLEFWSRQ
jgi:hypothetical protein